MAINKNHEFEELDGVKCGIVEKNVAPERAAFLKELLTINGFTVILAASPPLKTESVAMPTTFTIGVSDYTFNSINAIFGRLLKTNQGNIVTQAYWNQNEEDNVEEIPYYQHDA